MGTRQSFWLVPSTPEAGKTNHSPDMPTSHPRDQHIYDYAKSVADIYRLASEAYADCPAIGWRDGKGEFSTRSYRELYADSCALAAALVELGLQPREHVALLSDNCPEWMLCDCAILLCGGADVPRAADVTDQEISYIVAHSDSVIVLVEDADLLARVLAVRDYLPKVREVVLMTGEPPEGTGALRLADLVERGRQLRAEGDRSAEARLAEIKGDDYFTLIYTSGTTGEPKGVALTHDNMLSQARHLPFDLYSNDRVLSILPVWHSYERVFEMVAVSRGVCTYYTTIRTIVDDLRKVRPTFMASAPRLWEGLHARIMQKVRAGSAFGRLMFNAAYHCSREFQSARFFLTGQLIDLHGRSLTESLRLAVQSVVKMLVYAAPYAFFDAVVLKKLRAVVGGEFRGTVSGGGALPLHVDEFFNYMGIPVLEGYGMTETSPVLAVRTFDRRVIGTVGPIWPHTQIRIVELVTGKILYPSKSAKGGGRGLKGEIHAKGPQIMAGYYKNPEATARVLNDGWMNTGDLGMVTFNDCLKILGRTKETIVLLNGENVEPVPIETRLLESRFIEQCLVVGQDEKHLGALIVPCLHALEQQGFAAATLEAAAVDGGITRLIDAEVRRLVSRDSGFKPFETIHGWRFVTKPFEVGDELTNTFKPRRYVITQKYAVLVGDLFQHSREGRRR